MGVPAFTAEHTKGVCQITFEISDEMINADGRMGIGSLARQMQKITEIHFDQEAGLTGEELLAKGLSWVISWTDIELVRMPNKGEKVILRIWPGKNKVNLYSRVYAMYTEAGEPLMATSSLFFPFLQFLCILYPDFFRCVLCIKFFIQQCFCPIQISGIVQMTIIVNFLCRYRSQ